MQTRNRHLITYLLLLCIFFSGMCLEETKADSYFGCTSENTGNLFIDSQNSQIINSESCTTEMLGLRGASYVKNVRNSSCNRNDLRASLFLAYVDEFIHRFSNFHTAACTVQFPELYGRAVVLKYIHEKDGKK